MLWSEWRNTAAREKVGPCLYIEKDGGLLLNERQPTEVRIPAGEWVHFRITDGLGALSDAKLEMTITDQAGKTLFEGKDLACGPQFDRITWLGFVSNGLDAAEMYLDNVVMRRVEPAGTTNARGQATRVIPTLGNLLDSASGNLYADIATSAGTIVVQLHPKDAPQTVENFVGLAMGAKEFTDPNTGKQVARPFYNGILFHRVIPGFMIQAGDPLSADPARAGRGGPGFTIPGEMTPAMTFEQPGILAMARKGHDLNSAGSQFFITVGACPQLNGQYTAFGHVVRGQEVADAISQAPRSAGDRPLKDAVIEGVSVYRGAGPR